MFRFSPAMKLFQRANMFRPPFNTPTFALLMRARFATFVPAAIIACRITTVLQYHTAQATKDGACAVLSQQKS
jgi:hypothetical protein